LGLLQYYPEVDSTEQALNRTFHQLNDSNFTYFDEVEIKVLSYLKEAFKSIAEGNTFKVGTFIYVDEKRIRLTKLKNSFSCKTLFGR